MLTPGNRVCSDTIPTAEGQRQTVTPLVGTLVGEEVSPETQAIMAIVKWDGHPGESLVPMESIQKIVLIREQLSPSLQERCTAAREEYSELMLETLNGQIRLGSKFSTILAQFMEERGKRKGKPEFWQWLKEEMGWAAYFIEMAIEWYFWWQKLAPRVQEFLKKHPLQWGKAVYRALIKVTGVSIAMLKALLAREKTTAKDVKGLSEFYAELIPGAEVLVLNCPEKPEYVGRLGVVVSEPTEENHLELKMGTGEVLMVSVGWIVPTSQIVSDAGWEDLGRSHGLSADEIEQVKQEAMSLAARETQPGHYLIVKRSQLQAALKKMGIKPGGKKSGVEPPAPLPESKLYTEEQIAQLREQDRKEAIEQYKQEQLENNMRIQGEIREAALEQARKQNEADQAHREKLMVEKEELKGAVVERDDLIAQLLKQIEERDERLQLKESAGGGSTESADLSIEIEELQGVVKDRDDRIARLGAENEELRGVVLKLTETRSGSTSNQEQDSIPTVDGESLLGQSGLLEEQDLSATEREMLQAELARIQEEARKIEEKCTPESNEAIQLALPLGLSGEDCSEQPFVMKVMLAFWGAICKLVRENKELNEKLGQASSQLENSRKAAAKIKEQLGESKKDYQEATLELIEQEVMIKNLAATIASLRNKTGLSEIEMEEGKRIVVLSDKNGSKGCLGTVRTEWKGSWWVELDSLIPGESGARQLYSASELTDESQLGVFTREELQQRTQELQDILENRANNANKENLSLQQKLKELTENLTSVKTVARNVEKVTTQLGEILGSVRIPGWNGKGYRASNGLAMGGLPALQAFVEDVRGGRIDLDSSF